MQMAGMTQEQYRGSVTCPWCIANKRDTPGFLTECQVSDLIGPHEFRTYKQASSCSSANVLAPTSRLVVALSEVSTLKLSPC